MSDGAPAVREGHHLSRICNVSGRCPIEIDTTALTRSELFAYGRKDCEFPDPGASGFQPYSPGGRQDFRKPGSLSGRGPHASGDGEAGPDERIRVFSAGANARDTGARGRVAARIGTIPESD